MNFAGRQKRLRERLREKSVEAFLCTKRENVTYLCGFTGTAGILLINPEEALLITDGRYELQAKEEVQLASIEVTREDLLEALIVKIDKERQVSNLAFESRNLSYEGYEKLTSKVKIIPTRDLVEELRMIKEPCEVEKIQKGVNIAQKALESFPKLVKEGVTEEQIAGELDHQMRLFGARKSAFDTIVALSERAALPHATPTNRALRRGDSVLVDLGGYADGYCSDLTRTFFFGKPSQRLREVYEAVISAQAAALETLQAGKSCAEVDAAARDYLEELGYGSQFNHSLGHGVGLEIHEAPRLNWRTDTVLQAGMVVTVEPGVYLEGICGVRIEDLALVREKGCELLTTFPKDIDSAIIEG